MAVVVVSESSYLDRYFDEDESSGRSSYFDDRYLEAALVDSESSYFDKYFEAVDEGFVVLLVIVDMGFLLLFVGVRYLADEADR